MSLGRGAAAVGFVLGALLTSVAFDATMAAAQDQPPQMAEGGGDDLAGCVAEQRHLVVLFMVDQSGSLESTDPNAQRVVAIDAALEGIESLRSSLGDEDSVTIDVGLSGFDVAFEPDEGVDWVTLTGDELPALRSLAESYREREHGFDTDYVAALQGARRALRDRTREVKEASGGEPCKVLLWFTDGRFDIRDRLTSGQVDAYGRSKPWQSNFLLDHPGAGDELERIGLHDVLCPTGGLADQLRNDRVFNAVVALSSDLEASDESVLRSISTGRGGRCGGQPGFGTYVSAENPGDLVRLFVALANGLTPGPNGPGPTPGPAPVCPQAECPEGRRTFAIDPGLDKFNLLLLAGSPDVDVAVRAPGSAEPTILVSGESGHGSVDGVGLRWQWVAPDVATLYADLPDDDRGVGEWAVTFIDRVGGPPAAPADFDLYLFADLIPRLENENDLTFRQGQPVSFNAVLQRQSGVPLDSTIFDTVDVLAAVTDPAAEELEEVSIGDPDADGRITGQYRAPTVRASSLVNLSISVQLVTRSGVALRPVSSTWEIPVRPPVGPPELETLELRPRSVRGDGSTTATLHFRGSEDIGGCVWVDDVDFTLLPPEAGAVDVGVDKAANARGNCQHVDPQAPGEIEILFDPEGSTEHGIVRLVEGLVSVRLVSDADGAQVFTVDVPVEFEMHPLPPPPPLPPLVFAVLMAIGVFGPLVVLHLVNRRNARFQPLAQLRRAAVQVYVDPKGSVGRVENRDRTGLFEEERGTSFGYIPGASAEPTAGFDYEGVRFTAHAPPFITRRSQSGGLARSLASIFTNRFAPPFGEAVADRGWAVSSWRQSSSVMGDRARVPLALPGTWLFVTTTDDLGLDTRGERRRNPLPDGNDTVDYVTAPSGPISGTLIAFVQRNGPATLIDDLESSVVDELSTLVAELQTAVSDRLKDAARERDAAPPHETTNDESAGEAERPQVVATAADIDWPNAGHGVGGQPSSSSNDEDPPAGWPK